MAKQPYNIQDFSLPEPPISMLPFPINTSILKDSDIHDDEINGDSESDMWHSMPSNPAMFI